MKKAIVLLLAAACTVFDLYAQNTFPSTGAVGIGTLTPDASSLLEIKSTDKGFLPPRMTLLNRNAIISPAIGLLIYQTDGTKGLYYYSATGWSAITPASANTKLSNLASPVAVNRALLPKGTASLDFGSSLLNWRNIYLSGSLYHDSVRIFNANQGNVAVGESSLLNNTGHANTATGYYSLYNNTTGRSNTANGFMALTANTTGFSNTASGAASLGFNTTGSFNTAVGDSSLAYNIEGVNNTAAGKNALYSNTYGERNTATGSRSLFSNTTGSWNVADGAEALYANTSGYFNTASGFYALNNNNTGARNTSSGSYSMYNNTTGSQNAAFGVDALNANTTGDNNTASGFEALHNNTSGYSNVAVGKGALFSNTINGNLVAIGDSALYNYGVGLVEPYDGIFPNTAIGSKSMFNTTTGHYNTAIGFQSLYLNTTGTYNTTVGMLALSSNTTGSGNTANGDYSLSGNSTGDYNTANGSSTLFQNTTGRENTASGAFALIGNTTGSYNTASGVYALEGNVTGDNNTALGYNADVNANNMTNATAIGYLAKATASDQVMLGNPFITSVKAAGNFVIYSDGRFKKNIKENVPGLDFIKQLRPVTYNYDIHKLDDYINPAKTLKNKHEELAEFKKINEDAIVKKEQKVYTGFVAQEVEKIADKMGYDFSGVYKPQNDKDPYGLSYADFVVPLVKAVQELSILNDSLKAGNATLEARLEKIEALLKINPTATAEAFSVPSLEQNIPNPFTKSTLINYILPRQNSNARMIITDVSGKTIKEINISGTGKGSIKIDALLLAGGAYSYSLYVNNKMVESKQMVVAR